MHSIATENLTSTGYKTKLPAVNASIPFAIILGSHRLMALLNSVNNSNSNTSPLYGFSKLSTPGLRFINLFELIVYAAMLILQIKRCKCKLIKNDHLLVNIWLRGGCQV